MTRWKIGTMLLLAMIIGSCGGSGPAQKAGDTPVDPDVSGGNPDGDAFVITSSDQFIGGPLADARIGDIYVQNDKIRFIIQQPGIRGAAFGGSGGGEIIDADLVRGAGESGQDNLLDVFPLLNFEWTVNYQTVEILEDDVDKYGFVRVRATGIIDVQEWLTPSLIEGAMHSFNYKGLYPDRFNNLTNPLTTDPQFDGLSHTVVTDYILPRGASYIEVNTTLTNEGNDPISFPIGTWVGATGYMEMFIPMYHFANPYLEYKLDGNLSGLVYSQFKDGEADDTQVSYSYLYDHRSFADIDPEAENGTVVGVQGVAAVVPGQLIFKLANDLDGLLPICESNTGAILVDCSRYGDASIRAALPPGEFTYTSYMGIGNGSVGSALDAAYSGMGVPYAMVSGVVYDEVGNVISNARISVLDETLQVPVTVLLSDASGAFSGKIPTADGEMGERFGSGKYKFLVYKEGYSDDDGLAGTCNPATIDVTDAIQLNNMTCTLGKTVELRLGNIIDEDTGERLPAALTIAGIDPSPKTDLTGDVNGFYRAPYGVLDTLLYHPVDGVYVGQHRRPVGGKRLFLEPGTYEILIHRGNEYEIESRKLTLANGGVYSLGDIALKRMVTSPGYVSMDFHIHSRDSLDVPVPESQRALGAAATALDVFNSANHDVATSYADVIAREGLSQWMNAWVGTEVTPLLLGHFLAAGVEYDPDSPEDGGAVSFVEDARDTVGPERDYNLPLQDMFDKIREDPGEQVIIMAHILHHMLGYMYLNGLVTSPLFDVDPFSLFADPATFRLGDASATPPYSLGSVENSSMDFDGIELGVSTEKDVWDSDIMPAALPTAFNLFNMGKKVVMVSDNDGHLPINDFLGNVRNYCRSDVDPADVAEDTYPALNTMDVRDGIFRNVKAQHCFITNGPYVTAQVSKSSATASYGDTLSIGGTGAATLSLNVAAPAWVEWDQVDVYINDEPQPIIEEGMSEEAFHLGNPTYTMAPAYTFSTQDGTLSATVENGVRKSVISQAISFNEDSWIVIVVRGHDGVSNPIFPLNPVDLNSQESVLSQENLVSTLDSRFRKGNVILPGGVPTFSITNPIYVDVDGDRNSDGDAWEAKYVRDGTSPLLQ